MKQPKSQRAPFAPRRFIVSASAIQDRAVSAISNMPIDPIRPLEIVIREPQRKRKLDQQALMFAGPLKNISDQAWFDGRQYSVEVLHHYFKTQFLPEEFDPELCLEGFQKWDIDPSGERVLIGSTTQLTVRGFSDHLEQIYCFGAALGVEFSVNPMEGKP